MGGREGPPDVSEYDALADESSVPAPLSALLLLLPLPALPTRAAVRTLLRLLLRAGGGSDALLLPASEADGPAAAASSPESDSDDE